MSEKIGGFYGSLFDDMDKAMGRLVDAHNGKPEQSKPVVAEIKKEEQKVEIVKSQDKPIEKPKTDIVIKAEENTDTIDRILKLFLNSEVKISISAVTTNTIEFTIGREKFKLMRKDI